MATCGAFENGMVTMAPKHNDRLTMTPIGQGQAETDQSRFNFQRRGIYVMKTMANKSKVRHQTDGLPSFSPTERDRRLDLGRKIMAENDTVMPGWVCWS